MSDKTAIRDAFGEALKELGAENDKIAVLEADVGSSTKSILFGKEYPERYFNTGISEINMVSMAAGLALTGYVPYVNTFAVFMASRALDPVQSLIAYDHLPVRLCGAYSGMSDSYDGASHHSLMDLAAMRAIPGMTVISVSDPVQTKKAVRALADYKGPAYLRLSRAEAPTVYKEEDIFEIGKGILHREGSDVTIAVTGTLLHRVLEAADVLEREGIHCSVADLPTVSPMDTGLLAECAKKTGAILTVEEHSVHGGLGSAVAEVVSEVCPVPVIRLGLTETAESGDYDALLDKYGFSIENIAAKAKEAMAKKL